MAHFAEIDNNNVVLRVIVVNNSDILDSNGNESEEIGKHFCNNLLGGNWIQTSYNGTFRKNFAGAGMTYDSNNDVFLYPKPFDSWILDENYLWKAPLDYPRDGNKYLWDESQNSWVKQD